MKYESKFFEYKTETLIYAYTYIYILVNIVKTTTKHTISYEYFKKQFPYTLTSTKFIGKSQCQVYFYFDRMLSEYLSTDVIHAYKCFVYTSACICLHICFKLG